MNPSSFQSARLSPRFRGEVLNKIYRVWLFRRLLPVLVLETLLFTFLLYELGQSIFVRSVLENALSVLFNNPGQIVPFFFSAFFHASLFTKIITLAIAGAIAFFVRHATQGILRFILVRENYFRGIRDKNGT